MLTNRLFTKIVGNTRSVGLHSTSRGFTSKHVEIGQEPPTDPKQDTIFGKIIRKEIKADVVYEDDKCLAFRDVNPQAPTQKISQLSKSNENQKNLLGHLMFTAGQIAKQQKLDEGFRIVVNDGKNGGQSVYHLHLHIIGGRPLRWPPG